VGEADIAKAKAGIQSIPIPSTHASKTCKAQIIWYHSKSHQETRYYAGIKKSSAGPAYWRPKWTTVASEALVITDQNHLDAAVAMGMRGNHFRKLAVKAATVSA
jgi:hypothetical protein